MVLPSPRAALLAAFLVLSGCSDSAPKTPIPTFQIGEKVDLPPFIYSVIDTQWMTHIGEGVAQRVPAGRFLVVRLSITNTSSEENSVPALTLVDASDNSYPEVMDVGSLEAWVGLARAVKAADTLEGVFVFDVSPGTYRLRLQDSPAETRLAVVELPLKFDSPDGLLPQTKPDNPRYDEMLNKR
ncbi:MAG: DUF4352 domain-containing protein [Bryobacteraceae bacterium]